MRVNDPFVLYQPNIIRDILLLPIQYNGGCEIHDFVLYAHDAFLESNPPRVNLFLYHEGYDDPCYATPTEPGAFNLEALADLYYSYYQSYETMILNLYDDALDAPDPIAFSISYTPTMAMQD